MGVDYMVLCYVVGCSLYMVLFCCLSGAVTLHLWQRCGGSLNHLTISFQPSPVNTAVTICHSFLLQSRSTSCFYLNPPLLQFGARLSGWQQCHGSWVPFFFLGWYNLLALEHHCLELSKFCLSQLHLILSILYSLLYWVFMFDSLWFWAA